LQVLRSFHGALEQATVAEWSHFKSTQRFASMTDTAAVLEDLMHLSTQKGASPMSAFRKFGGIRPPANALMQQAQQAAGQVLGQPGHLGQRVLPHVRQQELQQQQQQRAESQQQQHTGGTAGVASGSGVGGSTVSPDVSGPGGLAAQQELQEQAALMAGAGMRDSPFSQQQFLHHQLQQQLLQQGVQPQGGSMDDLMQLLSGRGAFLQGSNLGPGGRQRGLQLRAHQQEQGQQMRGAARTSGPGSHSGAAASSPTDSS
jgi:hypothetical protein